MRFIYPAVFKKKAGGGYTGYFPDLEGCTAEGSDLETTIREANLAAYNWIMLEFADNDPDLPPVTDVRDLKLKKGETARNILVHVRLLEGWDE